MNMEACSSSFTVRLQTLFNLTNFALDCHPILMPLHLYQDLRLSLKRTDTVLQVVACVIFKRGVEIV